MEGTAEGQGQGQVNLSKAIGLNEQKVLKSVFDISSEARAVL